ncbi:Os11g0112650 [Oryza sativa Japonica Group]|uniref:Os11g0112650 protein n=1 Tax=Oryza sativa subsp. japonica TaxID=39947 RepID=A0A0P0XY21_ORYSJ|nr:Os11g0112650 [Oryza sativa Japonica Group]
MSGRHIIISLFPLLSLPPPPLSLSLISLWASRPAVGRRSPGRGGRTASQRCGGSNSAATTREKGREATAEARGAKATSIKIEQKKPRRISHELAQASTMEEVVVGKERKRPCCALVGVGDHGGGVEDEPGGARGGGR